MQGLAFGRCDDVVAVAVRDQEGWRLGRDSGEQAEVSGALGDLGHRAHAEQTRFEREGSRRASMSVREPDTSRSDCPNQWTTA
jgi:hypothetical protein